MKSPDRGIALSSAVLSITAAAMLIAGCGKESVEATASSATSQKTYEEPTVVAKTKIPENAPHGNTLVNTFTFTPAPTTTRVSVAERPGEACKTFPGFELVSPNAKANDEHRREVRLTKNTSCTVGLTALSGGTDIAMKPGEVMIVNCVRDGVGNTPGVDLATTLPGPTEYSLNLSGLEANTILAAPHGGMPTCPIK